MLHLLDLSATELHRTSGDHAVDRFSIVFCDVGDVLGRFQPAFDLEAAHARINQFCCQRKGGEILRTEQILLVAVILQFTVAEEFVRKTTRLRTLTSVCTAASQRFTGEALPGIRHTECTVDECFQLDRRLAVNPADFIDRQFSRQDHSFNSELFRNGNALGTGERHLRRSMDPQILSDLAYQSRDAQILHQHGIDGSQGQSPDDGLHLRQLIRKRQCIERHVSSDTASMQVEHDIGDVVQVEIRRSGSGVKAVFQAEINRIRAILDRRAQAVPVAGRRQKFGCNRVIWHVDSRITGAMARTVSTGSSERFRCLGTIVSLLRGNVRIARAGPMD